MRKSLKILLLILSLYSTTAFADFAPYNLLVPNLPGFKDAVTFPDYIPLAFNLAIGIGAGLAFVMITLGGITYATSDAITGKQSGREMITNAIYGLVLIVSAYAILWTINPNMLSLKLTIPLPSITPLVADLGNGIQSGTKNTAGNVKGVPMTDAQKAADAAVRGTLGNRVKAKDPCLNGSPINCVNLNGLSGNLITEMNTLTLSGLCNCNIMITGGTEPGHNPGSDHDVGRAVDITTSAPIDKLIVPPPGILQKCKIYTFKGLKYTWEPKGAVGGACGTLVPSSNDHWHVSL